MIAHLKPGVAIPQTNAPVIETERRPAGWPGLEVGWGIASRFRGKGYAIEAATASIDWVFAQFTIDQIVHCIERENIVSQKVARRLGASIESEFDLFGHVADVWVTRREAWRARLKP
jgi:RimJ/RimL family protein N-acetyltransferase